MSAKAKACELPLDTLSLLREFQMRTGLDDSHVEDMAAAIRDRKKLPRVKVYRLKDGRLIVVDGFHRCEAYRRAGVRSIPCDVTPGTWFGAFCAASAANKEHLGLKRSNSDKRRAVEQFLAALTKQGEAWMDSRIASHVGVSHVFVAKVRLSLPGGTETVSVPRVAADGRVYAPKGGATETVSVAPPPKYALPSGIRDLALGKDVPCPDPVRKQLTAAGVSSAGELYARLKAKDLCGLEAKEADQLRFELQSRYVATATAAAEHADPLRFLVASFPALTSAFSDECRDKAEAWLIKNRRQSGEEPFFKSGRAPTGEEVVAYLAAAVACTEFVRGPKAGASLLDGLAEPKPLADMVSEAMIDLGKGVKPAAVQEHIRAKHGDHYAESTIEECMSTLRKTPPTLTNGRIETKSKASICPTPELAMSALARLRLDQKLAKVRNFPPQVAGALSMRGISTVRDLLNDAQDLATQVVRVLESTDHATQAARCIKALRAYLDIRDQEAA
jgi:hypothetical protein